MLTADVCCCASLDSCAGCSQGDDPSACETRVVQLLGLDNFELAKELLKNRLKIVWVMKLRQAQDDTEVINHWQPRKGWKNHLGKEMMSRCETPCNVVDSPCTVVCRQAFKIGMS
jgi:hypothetical protein